MKDLIGALHKLIPLISLVLFTVAIAVVHHEINVYHWQEIKGALLGIPLSLLLSMAGLTLLGYLSLSLYDYLALEYAGEKLPYRRVLLASFLSYAISNNVGYALISGGSMRYRFYSGWTISAVSIAKIVMFCAVTYVIGALTLLVGGYTAIPDHTTITQSLPQLYVQAIIMAGAVFLFLWWGMVLFYRKSITIKGLSIYVPNLSISIRQVLVALSDLLLASLVLYLPLFHYADMPFGNFLVLYIMAQLMGLFSQVPGGIGVFEGSFLFLASGQYPSSHILAALIAYRAVYYFLPLVLAGIMLVIYESKAHRLVKNQALLSTLSGVEYAIPQIFSVLLLFGGSVLLFSGATPRVEERLQWLHYVLPLPLIEFSHLISSVAGVLLLFLSRAVRLRMDSAYFATVAVLGLGAVASLAKGWDYEEATILTLLLVMFLPARKHFYRKSALLSLDFPLRWVVLILLIVGLSTWLGYFSYKHVEYSQELWWQFSLHGDASRFLRSLIAIFVMSCGLGFYRLLTRTNIALELPDSAMLEKAALLVRHSTETMPYLALLGDKYLLWSESGNGFIMFDTTPKCWIAMGDPVGDTKEHEHLAWKFREMADRYGAKVAFYQVATQNLPLYLDLGLALTKLGEEARVPLQSFGLEGKKRHSLRHAYNKLEREKIRFEIISAGDVLSILPELRIISDRWLQDKRAREKRFSLGFFDETYISRCDVAVVKKENRILAFANLWQTDNKKELSIDLMRYDHDAPNGVMEYLTVSLMLWGKAAGYKWFNLGMAPLSGLEHHPLAPLWHKIGNTIFHFGGEFYNFEGLYHYKSKFDPVWQPRYLAAPAGLQVASTLLAVTGLISDGLKGVIRK